MPCFDDYITISEATAESRSGLYATDLPGIDRNLLDDIARSVTEDADDIWETIYKRSHRNLVSDTTKQLQGKFFHQLKLVTRETSEFLDDNNSTTGRAGITLEFKLPKYARLHILSIGVYSENVHAASDAFTIHDTDENGELLETINTAITQGRNTINVDTDYEVDKVFISYDPAVFTFRETESKYFKGHAYNEFGPVLCNECFYDDQDFWSSVVQMNGGGINVKFIIHCTAEKYVCENLKLFEDALLYKIGHEITVERRLGERLNKSMILTQERWDELEAFYKANYETNLMNTINGCNIIEDEFCFACKNTVRSETLLP